jgi:hypothetical protein
VALLCGVGVVKMKLLLKFLFQIPLLCFLVIGVYSVVGGNHLISALVGIFVLFLYTTGDYLNGAKDD